MLTNSQECHPGMLWENMHKISYNKQHGITPQPVKKAVHRIVETKVDEYT